MIGGLNDNLVRLSDFVGIYCRWQDRSNLVVPPAQTRNESRGEPHSATASGRGVVPLCGRDWPWGQCGVGGRRGLDDGLSRDRRGYAKQRSRGTSAASVGNPPVAAVVGDALPMKCGRGFGCPMPCCRSVSDRLRLCFRPPESAIARRAGGGMFLSGKE